MQSLITKIENFKALHDKCILCCHYIHGIWKCRKSSTFVPLMLRFQEGGGEAAS